MVIIGHDEYHPPTDDHDHDNNIHAPAAFYDRGTRHYHDADYHDRDHLDHLAATNNHVRQFAAELLNGITDNEINKLKLHLETGLPLDEFFHPTVRAMVAVIVRLQKAAKGR
jgi:hypothetical protein